MLVSPEHPRQRFLFCLDEDYDDEDVEVMSRLVRSLAESRAWVLGPPELVDQVDEPERPETGDQPIRTVGGIFEVYTAYPPWGEKLPREIDAAHLAEVKAVVDAMIEFTRARQRSVTLELDDNTLGWIENGRADEMIRETLLAEWEKSLAEPTKRA